MKKLLSLILTGTLVFSLTGCQSTNREEDTKDNTKATGFQNNYLVLSELANNLSSIIYSINYLLF